MSTNPNIILILTDQHRLSAVSAYGPTVCKTPNIDSLTDNGILFENSYTACPLCSPSRASIMTGKFPHSHGMSCNTENLGCSVRELQDGPKLLSRRLESAGYSLGYTGKWHMGTDKTKWFDIESSQSLPRDVGFEGQNFVGHGSGGFKFDEYKSYLKNNGFVHKVRPWTEGTYDFGGNGELEGPTESTFPYFLTNNTLSLLDSFRSRDKPFFLWHNFWGPHGPNYVPKEWIDLYRGIEIPPWPNYDWPCKSIEGPHNVAVYKYQDKVSWDDWAMTIRYYYASVSLIDNQIGRIVEHLRETGLLDNTYIIFSADHGDSSGSHGGLIDKGWHHFEETHRIPLIIRCPNGKRISKVVTEFTSLVDIYSTILDMANVSNPEDESQGRSLMPLANDSADDWRDTVVTEFNGINNMLYTQRTVRWDKYKYGFNGANADELYDLNLDPHEMNNVALNPDYSEILQEGRNRLRKWMNETNDPAGWLFDRIQQW